MAHGEASALFDLAEVDRRRPGRGVDEQVTGQVDRRQVADGDVVLVLRKGDLGAEIGEVDRAGVVVQRSVVDRVLPAQPRVAGGLEGDEDRFELLPCGDLLEQAHLAGIRLGDVLVVLGRKCLAVQLVEVLHFERIEEVPVVVVLHAFHELVTDPHRGVRGAGATVGITGVLTQVEELGEVQVPVLHVEAERAELLAAAADRAKDRVDRVHERDRAGRRRVVGSDGRTLRPQFGDAEADASGALGEPHHVAGGLGDVLHVILHLHDEAIRELRVDGAGVDEGGSRRQVLEPRHLLVEPDGVRGRVRLVEGEPHRDAHPEVLRHLQRVAVATLDAVAVVEGHDADVFEQLVVGGLEGIRQHLKVEEFGEA